MNLDATTFALEVLNFLVLVWLLQRLLYRPVLGVIERRKAEDEKTVAAAQALRQQAEALKAQYEQRLAHAAEDRERALAQLDSEIAAERARRMAAVEAEARAEQQRREALAAHAAEQREAERERQATALAARFATRLLDRLAGPALGDRLVDLALADLPALPAERRDALRHALASGEAGLQVSSAHPLSDDRRAAMTRALAELAGREVAPSFVEDPALKAGLRIEAGAWVLMADLRDELAFFGMQLDHGG